MDNTIFYPICDIIPDNEGHGMIIGNNGSLTYAVRLSFPEVYSLYKDEIERYHTVYIQAFSHMPHNSYVHKQDVYRRMRYHSSSIGTSYLSQADADHFSGREYMQHTCVLAFTLSGLSSLSKAYETNCFSYKEALTEADSERLDEFLSAVQFALNNLASLHMEISDFSIDELKAYVFSTANFYETEGIKDIHFDKDITAGKYTAHMYALTDAEFFSAGVYPVYDKDNTVSRDKSELYMSPAEVFGGIHLSHNHVYNQILFFYSDKQLKERLRKNLDDHIRNRGFDKINIPGKIEALKGLAKEISSNKDILCYAHFSVMLWDEDHDRLDMADKDLRSAFDIRNINYYIPGYGNLADVYAGGIISCVPSLGTSYMFTTSLSFAVSCFVHYSGFKNDPEGILFNDRLTQIPLRKDIWDAKNRRIKARNAVVVAPTGSGKSFFANNIVHQLLDQKFTVVAVEFGNSFKQLCYLYPDIAVHIEYEPSQPLGINPFDLEGQPLTTEKEDTLITLCLRFWSRPDADANLTVSLRKLINAYYKQIDSGHSFQNFYNFVTNKYEHLCRELNLKPEYFDVDSFRHVCSDFMPGGTYENLCSVTGVASCFSDKRFIHFELTKAKASPFVASIVMGLLFDAINNKILSDPSKKGQIIFDEYAETAQMKTVNSLDVNIHQTVAFYYQKIRKENGAVMTIIQSPVQLPDNEYTKGIVANTQLLYVLEGTEVVYDAVIDTFKIKSPAQINQLKSIQNNYTSLHPYSECWIRFGENYALTVRLEASRPKYLAFQTQGEIRSELDRIYDENGHNMQKAIEQYIEQSK